jgi:hypothetical protein
MQDTNTLCRLTENGKRLVGDQFLKGEAGIEDEKLSEYVEPLPGEPTADLETLDDRVNSVVDEYDQFATAMDRALASDVHRCLNISRRIAGDPGLWHWLAVSRYPHFVRHRWKYRSETAMREKFLGAGSDLYSNALHRLWWIAELTHDEDTDDYSLTESVFANQTMVNKVFDRWFARYEPATVAICEVLKEEPSRVIDAATNQFNHTLTSVQLEGLERAEAEDLIRQIVEEVR